MCQSQLLTNNWRWVYRGKTPKALCLQLACVEIVGRGVSSQYSLGTIMTWLSMGLRQFHQAVILPIYKRPTLFRVVQFSTTPRRFNCMVRSCGSAHVSQGSILQLRTPLVSCGLDQLTRKLQGSKLNDLCLPSRVHGCKGW